MQQFYTSDASAQSELAERHRWRYRQIGLVALWIGLMALMQWPGAARAYWGAGEAGYEQAGGETPAGTTVPDWLEPRGLNVVDLVGLVPEEHLQDAIVAYAGAGIVQYISGERNGDQVTIRAQISARYRQDNVTMLNCLGQIGAADQWPSAVPASQLRLTSGNTDVTDSIFFLDHYVAGQVKPIRGAASSPAERYRLVQDPDPSFSSDGRLEIPANTGCTIFLHGYHENLVGEFTFQTASPIAVDYLGKETFTFHSYIGPGNAGHLDSLRSQMQQRYPGIRHDKFDLSPPTGAEYILVTFPPTPVNAYAFGDVSRNLVRPTGGTYRLVREGNGLSVDHINTMGLPLHGQWIDADQAPGTTYLPYFADAFRLASPEYFVPAGIGFNSCMTDGGCPPELLDAIYNSTMTMTIYYYSVSRTKEGLVRVPLKQVGPNWSAAAASLEDSAAERRVSARPDAVTAGGEIYLPLVLTARPLPPDDPTGCPCGWFDELGRMYDFIPPQ